PGYVLRRCYHPEPVTENRFETGSWSVAEITSAAAAEWEPPAHDDTGEHIIALTDPAGNVLLQHFCSEEEADRVESTLQRALKQRQSSHGDNFTGRCPSEIIDSYPLTTDELRVLARHHAECHLKNSVWCVLMASGGTTELWI